MISINDNTCLAPTIVEAATIADILDRIGVYGEAELLDEYISRVSQSQDITKVAAFWEDIWKRLKGRTKRLFINEFREAHDAAKKVQDELSEKFGILNEKFDKITKALKTYQLADWYQEFNNFPGGDALLSESGFKDTYGRFMQAILGAKETIERQKKIPEVEKVFGPSKEEIPTKEELPTKEEVPIKEEKMEEVGEWSPVIRRQPAVEEHFEGNKIRIQLPWWNRWARKHLKRIPDKKGRNIFKVIPSVRDEKGEITQQTPVNLEQAMGEDYWKITSSDDNYIYLEKVEIPEALKPTLLTTPVGEELFKREPELPKPTFEEEIPEVYKKTEEPKGIEPTEEETEEPKGIEPTEEEKRKEEAEGIEAEGKGLKALEGTTWIRYNQNARKDLIGMYRPVRRVRPEVHDIITDKNLIGYLNDLWIKRHSTVQKGIELKSNDTSGIKLTNRLHKVMQLLNN